MLSADFLVDLPELAGQIERGCPTRIRGEEQDLDLFHPSLSTRDIEAVEIADRISGQNKSAIWTPCNAPNRAVKSKGHEALSGIEVPDHHGLVIGPRDDASAVGAHRHAIHRDLDAR